MPNTPRARPLKSTKRSSADFPIAEINDLKFKSRLLESIDDAIIVTDVEGIIRYWNPSAERLFGWEAFEVLGRSIVDVTPTDQTQEESQQIMSCLKRGEKWTGDFDVRHRSGQHFKVRVRNAPVFNDFGELEAVIGVSHDITDQRKAEVEIQLARQMADRANAAKSDFLAKMSHEMRTPLTSILGFAELLNEALDDSVVASGSREYATTIVQAGNHLLQIINNLLDLSKVESGLFEFHEEETDLQSLLKEVHKLLKPLAQVKAIEFDLAVDTSVPNRILCSPLHWRQILVNIAGNAIKFTNRGRVQISVPSIKDDASTIVFEISDTGIGMSPEQSKTIFEDFHQADSTIHSKYGGTGLGLSISQKLASQMHGKVYLKSSEVDRGSIFRVELPFKKLSTISNDYTNGKIERPRLENEETDRVVHNTFESLEGIRVLLAEDGKDNQLLIALYVRKAGGHIDIANNGKSALELFDKTQSSNLAYDLILTDIDMPEMNGYELARALRSRGSCIPIVAASAYALADDKQKCLDAGCNDYVSKPIIRSALINTISIWVKERRK